MNNNNKIKYFLDFHLSKYLLLIYIISLLYIKKE